MNVSSGKVGFLIPGSISSGIWNFTNVTRADGSPINISWQAGANGTLNMHWYLDANVSYLGTALDGAVVNATTAFGNLWQSNSTSNGSVRLTLLEYTRNSTNTTYYTPYSLNVTKAGYATRYGNSSVNFTNNIQMDIDIGRGNGVNQISCGDLTEENTVYTLTSNVTSTGTCFNVLANNVTLDCRGFEINYSNDGSVAGYGVNVTGYNFTTVKNCVVKEGNSGILNYGIYLDRVNFANVTNNNITVTGTSGDAINSNGNMINSFITDNYLVSNHYGIFFNSNGVSRGNILSGNQILTTNYNGIYIYTHNNNTISSNIISIAGTGTGIYLFSTTNNTLTSNQVNSSRTQSYVIYGTSSSHYNNTIDTSNLAEGLPVLYNYSLQSLTVLNNSANQYGQIICGWCTNVTYNNITMGGDGINLFYTNYSTVSNSNINTSNGIGIYLYPNANNNVISGNNVTTWGSYGYGIYLKESSNSNNLTNNVLTTNGNNAYGVFLYSNANLNTISNNNITTSGGTSAGIYLMADFNTIFGNIIVANSYHGIRLEGGNSNIITSSIINIYGAAAYGIQVRSTTNNNSFSNMNVKTNNTGNAFNIYDTNNNFTIRDSVLNSSYSGVQELLIGSAVTGGTWNFTNVTRADGSPINISWQATANGTLIQNWYLEESVTDAKGAYVSGANVTTTDSLNYALSELTDSNGAASKKLLNEYVQMSNSYPIEIQPNNGLVGLWHLNNDSAFGENNSKVYDFSGNGNNGTVIGATFNSSGKVGGAYGFDGINDYVDFGDDNSLNFTSSFTISAWIMGHPMNNNQRILIRQSGSVYYTLINPDSVAFQISNGTASSSADSGMAIDDEVWHHLVGVRSFGRNVSIYVDGALTKNVTDNTGSVTNSGSLWLGYDGATRFWNGSIDEVAIWNRALSADEISALYKKGMGNGTFYSRPYTVNITHSNYDTYTNTSVNLTNNFLMNIVLGDTASPSLSAKPENNSNLPDNYAFVNVTATDNTNISAFVDFDNSLVSWWRMDDTNGSVGECYDNETKILTLKDNKEEWKYFSELKDEKVAVL